MTKAEFGKKDNLRLGTIKSLIDTLKLIHWQFINLVKVKFNDLHKKLPKSFLIHPKWVLSFMADVVQQLFRSKSNYDLTNSLTAESIAWSKIEGNTFYSPYSGAPYLLFQGCLLISFAGRSTAGFVEPGGFLWKNNEGVERLHEAAAVADQKFSNWPREKPYWGWRLSLSADHAVNWCVIAIFQTRGKIKLKKYISHHAVYSTHLL